MKTKRTIRELVSTERGKRVYVYLANDRLGKSFLEQAEAEGFVFGDGAKPSERSYAEIMAVGADGTVNFVNSIGRMAFGANCESVANKRLARVDFGKYESGKADYRFTGKHL